MRHASVFAVSLAMLFPVGAVLAATPKAARVK
ncbi:hypothetical protein GGR90_003192 [Sphingopyxis italica]|uniref:Uncharacterized protein n=1 Tax=Sphingopyxis italica TaxID=1129133 RepID=A0A7X5XTH4_9SPHN|nr:hypothetical protein [Sphingopyxis italica]